MKIETKKSRKFYASLVEAFECEPDSIKGVKGMAEKWASELMGEVIADAIKYKKHLPKDEIEISVAVSIGEPGEDNDDNEE